MSCCYRKDAFKQTNKNPVDNFLTDQESEFHSTVLFVSIILNYNHPHSCSTDSHCNDGGVPQRFIYSVQFEDRWSKTVQF